MIILADSFSHVQVGKAWGRRPHLSIQKQPPWQLSAGEIRAHLLKSFSSHVSNQASPGPLSADPRANTHTHSVQAPANGFWLAILSSASVLLTFVASIFFLIYGLNKLIHDLPADIHPCPAAHQGYF